MTRPKKLFMVKPLVQVQNLNNLNLQYVKVLMNKYENIMGLLSLGHNYVNFRTLF
jgi:hypothetical protein